MDHIDHICSINYCPLPAEETERAESKHWTVTIYYCHEHAREFHQGTPLGPVGIDSCRVDVETKGTKIPDTSGNLHAIGPQ